MEYGAIDLHAKESQIRIVTGDGTVVCDRRIATTRARLTDVFGDLVVVKAFAGRPQDSGAMHEP